MLRPRVGKDGGRPENQMNLSEQANRSSLVSLKDPNKNWSMLLSERVWWGWVSGGDGAWSGDEC